MDANGFKADLQKHASTDNGVGTQRFFKTGDGEYSAGDVFIGVTLPNIRSVCRLYENLADSDIQQLLDSEIHEHRLAAVILIANQFQKATSQKQKELYDLYIRNLRAGRINNWDLIDASAEFIVGPYLADKPKDILYELAHAKSIWEKRAAILASFAYVKRGNAAETLKLAEVLLHDPHDLIQKAVGWMLREVGKRVDEKLLLQFLDVHAHDMPRTTLRYAVERLSKAQKIYYMQRKNMVKD